MDWTILAAANILSILLSCTLLAHALASFRWRNRGILLVLCAIIICGQAWLAPKSIATLWLHRIGSFHVLWLVNWVISAFSIVLLWNAIPRGSSDLANAARIDGCGGWAIFRHIVLPLVRRALWLITVLTAIGTVFALFEFWPIPLNSITTPENVPNYVPIRVGIEFYLLLAISVVMSGLLFAVFLYTRRSLTAVPNSRVNEEPVDFKAA